MLGHWTDQMNSMNSDLCKVLLDNLIIVHPVMSTMLSPRYGYEQQKKRGKGEEIAKGCH